ncbi:MAG TPA: ATP-binding protein [Mucilaginibacter sp.]|nr:ATP-binding protein [Mucilaginibacter sp.]
MLKDKNNPGFTGSVKGKIIIASVLACFALFMAWDTSKDAFKTVLNSFDNVSAPNEKLRLINEISAGIARIDQVQKSLFSKRSAKNSSYFTENKELDKKIDSLISLYPDRPSQIGRLNSLKQLLKQREKLYADYLNVKSGLVDYKSFEEQVESLNDMVNQSARQTDSLVTTSVKKTAVTTFFPSPVVPKSTGRPGFFKRLFGKKKPYEETENRQPYRVVDSEYHVKSDTLARAMRDSMIMNVGRTIQDLEKTQHRNSALFIRKEAMLNRASAKMVGQIQIILKRIENEAVAQANASDKVAEQAVKSSAERIGFIMLAFFIAICLLIYLILRDFSRINRYRHQIEAAREEAEYHAVAKQRFLSNISHEIRTPLQSILGYTELVKKQPELKDENIDAIYTSSHHLLQIVNEVLDYNRIVSGKLTINRETFNIQHALNEVVSVLRLQATDKGILLKIEYGSPVTGLIGGDQFRLKQMLYNLIGNAIKFTNEGEVSLRVTSTEGGGHVRLRFEITDTGIGLSEQDISRIFNEFEQAGDEKAAKKGTGLGLAITRQLAELQGGKLWVKSTPGKGSCFTFELPFGKISAPQLAGNETGKATGELYPHKIWVIDDDPFILSLTTQLCMAHNILCKGFSAPSEMLNATWDDEVEVLLIDVRMPEMSGIELCHLMRSRVPAETRIYALTAQVMPDENQNVLKGGFDKIITKPFTETGLLSALKKHETAITAAENTFDPATVEKMTFGDPDMIAMILARFSEDTLNDIEELCQALQKPDIAPISLLLHRIAGRTAQIGGKQLSQRFRIAEMKLEVDNNLTGQTRDEILTLSDDLRDFVKKTSGYSANKNSAV